MRDFFHGSSPVRGLRTSSRTFGRLSSPSRRSDSPVDGDRSSSSVTGDCKAEDDRGASF